MFGTAGDDDLTSFPVNQSYRIANGIAPGAGIGTDEDSIIFIALQFHESYKLPALQPYFLRYQNFCGQKEQIQKTYCC